MCIKLYGHFHWSKKRLNVFTFVPLSPAIFFFLNSWLLEKFCFLLYLRCYVPVNSYSHVEMVSSPNHTFSWASLIKGLTSAHNFACNLQQPFLNQPKEENDHRNYFTINLHESMGLGQDWTRDLWTCYGLCLGKVKVQDACSLSIYCYKLIY